MRDRGRGTLLSVSEEPREGGVAGGNQRGIDRVQSRETGGLIGGGAMFFSSVLGGPIIVAVNVCAGDTGEERHVCVASGRMGTWEGYERERFGQCWPNALRNSGVSCDQCTVP